MPTYTPEQWRTMLKLDALEDRENLPRGTLTAVMRAESMGKSTAVSPKGAGGLFQLMPATAAAYKADRFDPQQAAAAAAQELGSHYKRYHGDLQQTLAAWNWGSGNLQKKGLANAPAETRGFIPRVLKWLGPASAEAAEAPAQGRQRSAVEAPAGSKWEAMFPGKPPTATAAPQPASDTPATSRWESMFPGKPPSASPEASPTTPAPAPLPTQPPAVRVAPVPQGGVPEPPTARSTPAQDAAYRQSVGQEPPPREDAGPTDLTIDIEKSSETPPAAPVPQTHAQRMAARPWWQKMWGTPSDPHAPDTVPPSVTFSPGYVEPGLEEQNPPREWAATGIELGSGILAATAATPGGPLAMWPAGAAGQSYGRRLNVELGLRDAEEPIATLTPGLSLYPSDVLNVTLGFLTEAVPIRNQLLGKTQAGKAILAAERETKAAFAAWKEADDAASAAQQKGQTKAWEEAMGKARVKRMEYENKVKARGKTIEENQAVYDAAEAEWKAQGRRQILRDEGDLTLWEKEAADARTREYGAARTEAEATQEGYQGQVAAREQQIREQARQDALTGRREQARAASEQDLYQRDLAERQAADVAKAQEAQAAAEGKFAGKQAEIQSAQQGQQQAIREAQQLPYTIRTGDKPAWQLYDDWRAGAKDVQVSPAQGKTALQELRNERPTTMAGTREPFSPSVEEIVKDIEKAGDTVSVLSIYEAVKKLGKLSRSKEAVVRREAAQVGEILGDMLEQSPANNAQLGAARRAWRREAAQDTMQGWMGEKGVVATDRSGRKVINPGALKEKFEREMAKPLFAKSFTPSETQAFADFYESLAQRTPLMPSVQATRAPMPAVKPPTPSAIPEPPPPRGLTAPTPPPPEVPVPTPETLPGGLADKPPGVGAPPQTRALPDRPTAAPLPPEVPPPRSTHVPYVEKGPVPPKPTPVPQTRPVRGKTDTGEPIPGETAAAYKTRVDAFNKKMLGERPKVVAPLMKAGALGGMAFALQRMGIAPGTIDVGLYLGAGAIAANVAQKHANYFLSKAALNPRFHDLMRSAIRDDQTIDPLFYNVMLQVMTREEARDMPKELREQYKKVRR